MNELPGARRDYDSGITLCDGPIRVRLFPDCVTISANNEEGIMKLLSFMSIAQQTNNVDLYKDACGDTFLVEIFFTQDGEYTDGLEVNT